MVDSRQIMIVLQNSMAHATAIAIHNSKGKEVDPKEVFEIAKQITKEVINTANKVNKDDGDDGGDDLFKKASKHFKRK